MTLLETMKQRRNEWLKFTLAYAMRYVKDYIMETQDNDLTVEHLEFVLRQSVNGEVLLGDKRIHILQLPKEKKTKEEMLRKFREQLEQEGMKADIDETIEIEVEATGDSSIPNKMSIEIGSIRVDLCE